MPRAKKYRFAMATAVFLFSQPLLSTAVACTTFCLFNDKDLIFGRNYDFPIGYGHVVINKRGVFKSAMVDTGELPARWTSKYGSLTFNQSGRDNPMGGMNETGLIIELMQLEATQYPHPDSRPAVGCLEWIQYQLDNCATVEEVIRQAGKIRIRSRVGIHYLIVDGKGETASIEFLGGKQVCHRGDEMPVKALANSTYEESLAYMKRLESTAALPNSMNSLDRFVRAGVMAKNYQPSVAQSAIDYAFDISGDIAAHFINDTTEANRRLVMASLQNSPFTKHIPVRALEEIAKHPENSSCRHLTGSSAKGNATTTSTRK